ncbi:hypothetical protein ATERTT37_007662 [Aspergillus terreus]
MSLLNLPTELIFAVLDGLDYESDIDSLARTSRAYYNRFNPLLYRHNVHHGESSALPWGIIHGSMSTVEMALDAGASPDRPGSRLEEHPAALAAIHGRLEMLQLLGKRGLDIQDKRTNILASFSGKKLGDKTSFVHIIEKQAEFNPNGLEDRISWDTLLMMAAKSGHEPIVRFLLELSPQAPKAHPPVQWTMHASLSAAVSNGHLSVVELLLDRGACMETKDGNVTLLLRAIMTGNQDIVQLLLRRGRKPSNSDSVRMRLICVAAKADQLESVRCFLHAGALLHPEPNLPMAMDTLNNAVTYGSVPVIDLLLESFDYVQLATEPKHKTIVLCAATACGRPALVRDLLESHGCNLNGYDEDSYGCPPPLCLAVKYGHAEIVELLLAHGADPSPKFLPGPGKPMPPNLLWYAASRGYERIVVLLLAAGIDPNDSQPLEGSALEPYVKQSIRHDGIFRRLLDAGLDLGQHLRPDSTVANAVVRAGRPAMVRMMLHDLWSHVYKYTVVTDALVNGKEVFGLIYESPQWFPCMSADVVHPRICREALELATEQGRPDLLELLLDRGLSRFIRLWQREFIVKAARSEGPYADPEATLDLLIRHGAEFDSRYSNGSTPLAVVACEGKLEPVRLLLDCGANPLNGGFVDESPLCRAAGSEACGSEHVVTAFLEAIDKQGKPWSIIQPHVQAALEAAESRHRTRVIKTLRQYAWRRQYPIYHVQCCQ